MLKGNRYLSSVATLFILMLLQTSAHALSFTGSGTGPIPDGFGMSPNCHDPLGGPLRAVAFSVSGLTSPISTVGVRFTFSPAHTYLGDVHVQLAAPGVSPIMTIFGDTGTSAADRDGSAAHLAGPYVFSDSQPGNWWTTAAATASPAIVPAGGYRTSAEGAATITSLNSVFGGLTPAQANGTWTLLVSDDCQGDIGGVGDATLFIDDPSMPVRLESYSVD